MPFVSVFFHFIIDLGLFCETTGHQGHLFLKLHVRAGVYFYFSMSQMSRCPVFVLNYHMYLCNDVTV